MNELFLFCQLLHIIPQKLVVKCILFIKCIIFRWFYITFIKCMRLTNVHITRTLGRAIIPEVSKFMQSSRSKWQSKLSPKKAMKSYSSTILVVRSRELSGYVANDGTIFHHADSVFFPAKVGLCPTKHVCHDYIAVFSLKSELLFQY